MSTSEYRAVDAESELPISAAELAALASQLYAASIRPGPDSPPQTAPVAPRGGAPDTTAATSAGQTTAGASDPFLPPVPARRHRRLRSGADVSGTGAATADGSRRPARRRARHDGGTVGRRDAGGVADPFCRPASVTSAHSRCPPMASSRPCREYWQARPRPFRWLPAVQHRRGLPGHRRCSTSVGPTRHRLRRLATSNYRFLTKATRCRSCPTSTRCST